MAEQLIVVDSVAFLGHAVKAMGGGRIGGVVAPYGSADDPDPQNDFFSPGTDFGLDVSNRARVIYHHGFTREYGRRKLGVAELRPGTDGLEGETTLDLAQPGMAALYARARAGELYWSSGSAERLVERRSVKGASEIVSWPIVEVSLTPNPVNRKARALPIKSLREADPAVAARSLSGRSESLVADAEELLGLCRKAASQRLADGRPLSRAKRDAIKALGDALLALHAETAPRPDPETLRRIKLRMLAGRL